MHFFTMIIVIYFHEFEFALCVFIVERDCLRNALFVKRLIKNLSRIFIIEALHDKFNQSALVKLIMQKTLRKACFSPLIVNFTLVKRLWIQISMWHLFAN